ncbi:unknown [Bacteroides clarus CAG:160]|nr:unknown [Bacteroides clarus CAG:160]
MDLFKVMFLCKEAIQHFETHLIYPTFIRTFFHFK